MGRAPCCDKANVKKGPWSPDEDAKLRSHIEKHGTGGNWIALPQKIGLKRCGKSCRLRWLNYLRPNIKHGGYTEDEDNLICSLYVSIGSRWSIIAAQLPGRTDNDIKNYWNTRLKKKLLGKQQRREHQTRRNTKLGITTGLKGCDEETVMSLYQQTVAQPLLVGYEADTNSTLTNISSIMPQMEANFCYDHTQVNINQQGRVSSDAFHSRSDVSCAQNQQICSRDSTCTTRFVMENGFQIDLPSFDGMYDGMPQVFDGLNSVNSSTHITSSSAMENTTSCWGDHTTSSLHPSMASNYQVNYYHECFTLFDEPRLLGYSQ